LCDTGLLILKIRDAIELVEKDIPNAFSPDGNGTNDVWNPLKPYVEQSYQIEKAELSIINKWGELLFHDSKNFSLNSSSDDYFSLGWDGEVGGQVVPSGTYYFSLRLVAVAGKEITVTRSLTVIR
jgi:gliding motility-associated-like protein